MTARPTIGRYQIRDELGEGGMGTVYLAFDPTIGREVAIKVLQPHLFSRDPDFWTRFEREVHTIAALEHRNIVPLYDFGEEGEWLYFVMRYMKGGTLSDKLTHGPLSLDESIQILERIGNVLDKAHSLGIVHRDLKPGNILFDEEGHAFLSDFGIVKTDEPDGLKTRTEQSLGTPQYMSPEQLDRSTIDGRSDIYSLGIILYEMLTGVRPFDHPTSTARVIVMHLTRPVPSLAETNPNLPLRLDPIIQKATAKEPTKRYLTIAEMVSALKGVLRRPSAQASTVSMPEARANERKQETAVPAKPTMMAKEVAQSSPKSKPAAISEMDRSETQTESNNVIFYGDLIKGATLIFFIFPLTDHFFDGINFMLSPIWWLGGFGLIVGTFNIVEARSIEMNRGIRWLIGIAGITLFLKTLWQAWQGFEFEWFYFYLNIRYFWYVTVVLCFVMAGSLLFLAYRERQKQQALLGGTFLIFALLFYPWEFIDPVIWMYLLGFTALLAGSANLYFAIRNLPAVEVVFYADLVEGIALIFIFLLATFLLVANVYFGDPSILPPIWRLVWWLGVLGLIVGVLSIVETRSIKMNRGIRWLIGIMGIVLFLRILWQLWYGYFIGGIMNIIFVLCFLLAGSLLFLAYRERQKTQALLGGTFFIFALLYNPWWFIDEVTWMYILGITTFLAGSTVLFFTMRNQPAGA